MSPNRRHAITAALLLGTLLSSMEVMVVGPAMPAVVQDLGQVGLFPWVFTANIVMNTLAVAVSGALADRYGRARLYGASVALFLLGSAACAMAPSMAAMVAARAVQGAGGGALITLTLTIFGDLYPVAQRTRVQGLFSLVWGVSSLLGPPLGGFLTQHFGWRGVFWVSVPPGLLAGAAVLALLPPASTGGGARPRGGLWGLLRDPTQQAIAIGGVLLGGALLGVIGYLPVWVRAVEHGDAMAAGLAMLPMSISWTLGANIAGRVVHRFGFRAMVRTGSAIVAAGALGAALWPGLQPGFMLFGLGMGFCISTFTVSGQEAAPPERRGAATSLGLFSRSVGQAAAAPLLGLLAGFEPGVASFEDIPGLRGGMERVWLAVALSALAGAAVIWARFPSSPRREATG